MLAHTTAAARTKLHLRLIVILQFACEGLNYTLVISIFFIGVDGFRRLDVLKCKRSTLSGDEEGWEFRKWS